MDRRYGPYIIRENQYYNAKDQDPEKITMEQALILISEKAAKGKRRERK